jgi:hypothetical protein
MCTVDMNMCTVWWSCVTYTSRYEYVFYVNRSNRFCVLSTWNLYMCVYVCTSYPRVQCELYIWVEAFDCIYQGWMLFSEGWMWCSGGWMWCSEGWMWCSEGWMCWVYIRVEGFELSIRIDNVLRRLNVLLYEGGIFWVVYRGWMYWVTY